MTRILHVSDIHFGRHTIPAHIDALEHLFAGERFDVVAFSGDLTQRARIGEFQRASVLLRDAARYSRVIAVPGNHDVAWWFAPLHLGDPTKMYAAWRRWLDEDLEPVLSVPGATIVGLNTAHGISPRTLTMRARDLSVIGDLRESQLRAAARAFAAAPPGDARVVVMHHNPVRGELSQRLGLKQADRLVAQLAETGAEIVLCGHDHQEAVHHLESRGGLVVATAGTLCDRSRGGRPGSMNVVEFGADVIEVAAWVWDGARFVPTAARTIARRAVAERSGASVVIGR